MLHADLSLVGGCGRKAAQGQGGKRKSDAVYADIGKEHCQPCRGVAFGKEKPDADADKHAHKQLTDKQQERGKAEEGKGVPRGFQFVAGFLHFTLHGVPPKQLLHLF